MDVTMIWVLETECALCPSGVFGIQLLILMLKSSRPHTACIYREDDWLRELDAETKEEWERRWQCHAPNVFGTVVIGVGNYRGMGNPQGSGVRVLRGTGCLFCTPVPLGHNPWYPWADYFELDYVLQLSTFTNDNSHLTTLYHHLNQPCHHYNTWRWWIVISSGEWQWRQGWIVAETANTVNAMSLTPVACPTDRYVYFILLFHFLPLLTGPLHHTPQPPVLCSCFYMYVFLFFICDDPTAASMM